MSVSLRMVRGTLLFVWFDTNGDSYVIPNTARAYRRAIYRNPAARGFGACAHG